MPIKKFLIENDILIQAWYLQSLEKSIKRVPHRLFYVGIFRKEKEMFLTMFYIVEKIDGDYAHLRRTDEEESELKLVARALLPDGIQEGTRLKYEFLQYEIVE